LFILVVCEWKESSAVSFPGDTLHSLIRIHSLPVAAADSEKRDRGGGAGYAPFMCAQVHGSMMEVGWR
jgi:hypothetical protein